MTTTIHFVRHAPHGLLGRALAGRMDGVHLTPEGTEVAERLAERLADEPIRAVYASPLLRTRETAKPIASRLGLGVETREALNEVDYGEWTGKTFAELDADPRWPEWNRFRSAARAPGGETLLEVQARMVIELERLCARHPDQTILLVGHGDPIRTALCFCLGLPLDLIDRIEVEPARVSTAVIGNWGAKVLSLNVGEGACGS